MDTCRVCQSAAIRVVVTKKGKVYQRCLICGAVRVYRVAVISMAAA